MLERALSDGIFARSGSAVEVEAITFRDLTLTSFTVPKGLLLHLRKVTVAILSKLFNSAHEDLVDDVLSVHSPRPVENLPVLTELVIVNPPVIVISKHHLLYLCPIQN